MMTSAPRSVSRHQAAFFDRAAVLQYMDKRTLKFLRHAGGYVRKTARNSMRQVKKPSPPGQPPRARSGQLKEMLYFSFEPRNRSVVVGPAGFGKSVVPRLLEEGGTEQMRIAPVYRHGKIVGFSHRKTDPIKTARYPARPYMKPAFDKALAQRRAFWRQAAGGV
jgi:hypothetical protein